MRLIFASVGAYGHTIPLVPLALAARDAGHEVAFATDLSLHPMLSEAGLNPMPAGTTVRAAIGEVLRQTPPGARPNASPQAFGSVLARRAIADLTPVLRTGKTDLVVYEVLNPGAGIAAGLSGLPAVCHGIGRVSGGPNWRAMSDTWVATARESGLSLPATDPQFFGNPYLDICPPSLQQADIVALPDRIPMRPAGWCQGAELPSSLENRDASRPLVYLTLGTAFGEAGVLRTAVEGLSRLRADVIVSAGGGTAAADLGDVPANVLVERWVPQSDLLPHVDLVVSHGGSGTTLESLAHGLPHLVIPQGADQFSNAQMVVDAGAGRRVLPADLTADVVFEHARALLEDPRAGAAAGRLRGEIAGMPSPEETVERLTALVG
ncbi:glycosyltransferase [Streptomyces sp. NPDC051576]|uniref:glycosyltransferase n=1 Tax=Streptomyces sp. NPDC051576 TaxID=3155803 RepID=UPI00343D30CA